jgi:hypothetical protein
MTQHLREAQTDLSSLPTAGDVFHQQPAHQANIASITDLVVRRLLDDPHAIEPPPTHTEPPPNIEPVPPDIPSDVANILQC